MSSDPRYVVLTKETWDAISNHEKQLVGPPLDLVVIGHAEAKEGPVDPAINLSVEMVGAFLSAINSGQLDAVQILECLYQAEQYFTPLSELVIHGIMNGKEGTGMTLLMGDRSELPLIWGTRNGDHFQRVMAFVRKRQAEQDASEQEWVFYDEPTWERNPPIPREEMDERSAQREDSSTD